MTNDQGAHAELYGRVAAGLAMKASQLQRLAGEPAQLSELEVGSLFLATGVNVLIRAGVDVPAYLRDMAAGLEAGNPTAN